MSKPLDIPTFEENKFYMALPLNSTSWIIVEYHDEWFFKTNNTHKYSMHDFEKIHPKPVFDAIESMRGKCEDLKQIAGNYFQQLDAMIKVRKALQDNESVHLELLKIIGSVVDQLQGNNPMMGYDLESTNTKIIELYTLLKERGALE